jgi:hypothetical protein
VGRTAQERISSDLLSSLNRFEQEGVRRFAFDAQISRDRGEQIGHHRFDERHNRPLRGEREKLFVGCWGNYRHRIRGRSQNRKI